MSRIEEQTVGSGITRHKKRRVVIDGPLDAEAVTALKIGLRAAASANAPWAWLEKEKRIAQRTLERIEAGERGDDGERIFEPHHGAGWYSREIMEQVHWIERARDGGDMERACRHSAELMELATTIRLKCAWDHDIEKWLKIVAVGEESRRGRPAEQRVAAVNELRSRGVSAKAAIATVASEDGVSFSAVDKQYYPTKKKNLPG